MESRRKQKTQWVYSRPPAELTLNTKHNNQQSIDWIQFGLRTVNSLNNITGTRLTSSHNLLRRSRDLPVVTGRFHLPFGRDKLRSSVLWWISRLGRVCRGLVEGFPCSHVSWCAADVSEAGRGRNRHYPIRRRRRDVNVSNRIIVPVSFWAKL